MLRRRCRAACRWHGHVVAQDAVELGAEPVDALRLWWLKKWVRNSTAMQSSASKAWASRSSLHCVLMSVRCTLLRYQVDPISTRRCGHRVHVGGHADGLARGVVDDREWQHGPPPAAQAALDLGPHLSGRERRVPEPHSSPSFAASIRPSRCSSESGSSVAREARSIEQVGAMPWYGS